MTLPGGKMSSSRSGLSYTRSGRGAPLVLIHGLGLSRAAWAPVLPLLVERFDVVAVDLPGFGESPPLPDGVEASPAALAASVAELLDELGLRCPHVVGNSLGGWVALELAQLRRPASLTLVSPAGMWKTQTPRYCRISLRATRWLAAHAERLTCWSVRFWWGRALVLGQSHGRPVAVAVPDAQRAVRDMGRCAGFPAALRATLRARYVAVRPLDVPTTVAFGRRDRVLLRRQSRRVDELPARTQVGELPRCGHVPTARDAPAVAALINATVARAGVLGAGPGDSHQLLGRP
jgi:pimeloyl-ACP methyl ester carboxylesterase